MKKKAEKNSKALRGMNYKVEGIEQSLQQQVKINGQLKLQIDLLIKSNWFQQLNYLANSGNKIVPIVIKLQEFEKHKKTNEKYKTTDFFTKDRGYKMYLQVYPQGDRGHIAVDVILMKGDYDDRLPWPVRGTLTVQLLNHISDSNHSEPVMFVFNGLDSSSQRVMQGASSAFCIRSNQFMSHERLLSYNADKNSHYLINDCVFLRVCSFQ